MADQHSILAPSAAARWVKCPASVRLSQQYPDAENEAALEGTAAHWAAHQVLGGNPYPAGGYNGVPVETDEMREAIALYVDTVAAAPGRSRYFEHRIEAHGIHPLCWGTADAVIFDGPGDAVRIVDFKYGHGFVDAFENWQLLVYAAGLMGFSDTASYELIVVQPRNYAPGGPVRRWTISTGELREYARRLQGAANEAMGNNPDANVGSHCKHCPARHACKALQRAALDAVDMSADSTPVDLPLPALSTELALLVRARDQLDARITGLEAQAMQALQAGKPLPHWQIDHPPGRQDWVKPAAEVLALGGLFGTDLSRPVEPITPAQALKKGIPESLIATYAARKTGAAKLVPINTTAARRAFGASSNG